MDVVTILEAAAILGGVGLAFALLIAAAHRRFWVWEDPRIEGVNALLPNANCGACGLAGCRAFAEAVVKGEMAPAGCTVINDDGRAEIADYLGVDAGSAVKRVARLLCAGGTDVAPYKAAYHGIESCAAAVAVSGGGKGCAWGCVGLGDCAVACTFDAIRMGPTGLPLVDPELCTACEDCVDACPLGLFTIMPVDEQLIVQCRNLLDGDDATAVCAVACNACGRCVQDAAPGLIEIRDHLAVIDYSKIELADPVAIGRCPTGAIAWVEWAQFSSQGQLAGSQSVS